MEPVRPVNIGRLALSHNIVLAPMAGYTQRALRLLARGYGAALAHTEMISAYEILRPGKKTRRLLNVVAEDRPLGLQIFGGDAALMAGAAARAAELGCFDLVDLNLACPVRKVVARGHGGARLKDPQATLALLEIVRRATPLPLTIKVRRGYDDSPDSRRKVVELLTGAERLGLDAATIHGRTVQQIYHGRADWDFVYEMAARLTKMPVFGSGDLSSPEAIVERLRGGPAPPGQSPATPGRSPVAGVAVARGAVGQPWIFREALALARGQALEPVSSAERIECLWRHFDLLCQELGDYAAVRIMRRFGMFYSKKLPRAREARVALGQAKSRDDFADIFKEFFEQ